MAPLDLASSEDESINDDTKLNTKKRTKVKRLECSDGKFQSSNLNF